MAGVPAARPDIVTLLQNDPNGRFTTLIAAIQASGADRIISGDGPITIGVRSEDVVVGSNGVADARVHHIENHGVEKIVTLRAGKALFKATVPAVANLKIEEPVRFALNQERLHGFDPASGANRAFA